ncbi:MAG: K(+)-transporting ATPase subunit F [Thermoanaerobaculia bacterium]
MSGLQTLMLLLSIVLAIYLFYALFDPERFG